MRLLKFVKGLVEIFFFGVSGGYQPHYSTPSTNLGEAVGKCWGSWSSRGSNLPPSTVTQVDCFYTSAALFAKSKRNRMVAVATVTFDLSLMVPVWPPNPV